MALATSGTDGAWVNPVAFAYNERAELFFISMMDSKHTKNLLANPKISVAIYKTERFPSGDVLGLQLVGLAKHLTGPVEIKEAARYHFGRSPSNEAFREQTSEKGGPGATWQFFKITPAELWCFDSRVFGEKRVAVDLDSLELIGATVT